MEQLVDNKKSQKRILLFGLVSIVGLVLMLVLSAPKPMSESIVPPGAVPMETMDLNEVVNATSSNVTGQAKMTDEARMLNSLGFSTTQGHPISIK